LIYDNYGRPLINLRVAVTQRAWIKDVLEEMKAKGIPLDYKNGDALHYLHWEKDLSTRKMAALCRVKSPETVRYWMGRRGIPRKHRLEAVIEALTLYEKPPFSGSETEKWGMLGFVLGDIHARKHGRAVCVSVSTTHRDMIERFHDEWKKYGHCGKYPVRFKDGRYGWRVYCLLDGSSFNFLLHKPNRIPEATELFNPFLTNLSECEGSWGIYDDDGCIEFRFDISNTDYGLLKQIGRRMEAEGYHPLLYLSKKAGVKSKREIITRKNCYTLRFERRAEVISLAERLLPHTRHKEKAEWMRLILELRDKQYWEGVKDRVLALRNKIDEEVKECVKEAESEYEKNHIPLGSSL